MAQKDNFQKQVVQTLQNSGFKEIFEQKQHKEFIEMIAATYFTNELTFESMIEYLADIVDNEDQRKAIAEIIRDAKAPKVQKKPQPPKEDKTQKSEKKPQKKVKTQNHPKPKEAKTQTKPEKPEDAKQEAEGQVELPNGGQKKGLKQELENQGKAKCRFFPFCKNQDTGCEFFHPTDKCQYFPNCRYGENCLYVHEACRFKEKCTKLNCPYAHPGKRPSNPLEAFMKNMMMSKNPNMFNKQKPKRPRHSHQDGKEDEHQQQEQ